MGMDDRIKAVAVLQRFVLLSRTLLPRFSELMEKKELTADEARKASKISDVYESFQASAEISVRLINSNIIQLIRETYTNAKQRVGQTPQTFHVYNAFLKESDRLISIWNKQRMN